MKKAGTSGISSSKKDHDWSDLALKDEDESSVQKNPNNIRWIYSNGKIF